MAVCKKMNFTAAAQSLFVSQPALSKQIRLMEEELETKLFTRGKRSISLTEAGEAFRCDLEVVLQDLRAAIDRVKTIGTQEMDQVQFAYFPGPAADDVIYRISEKLKTALPGTQVLFQRGSLKGIRQALDSDSVDIILTIDFELPELYACPFKKVYSANAALVYSENSPLAAKDALGLEDFRRIPLLLETPEMCKGAYRNAIELMRASGIREPLIETYESWETLITYLKMGHGYSVMFENVCRKIGGLKQYLIPDVDSRRNIVAVWKHDSVIGNL